MLETEPENAGGREQRPVVLAGGDLPDPRVDVSPDRADLEVGPKRAQLGRAAQAARPDDGSFRQVGQRLALTRDETVAHVLAPRHRADDDAVRVLRGQILQRVHGEVDLAVPERPLELLGEEPLAADLGQRLARRLRAVARRRDHSRLALEVRPGGRQQADDRVGLRPRECRGPGSEGDRRLPRRSAH